MKVIVTKNYEDMSKKAADIVAEEIKKNKNIVLGLPTGGTPKGMYKELINKYNKNEVDFSYVKTFNLDEYVGLDGNNPNSYRYFMNETFFDHVNIPKENTHIPDGMVKDPDGYGKMYDEMIKQTGGIDLQILGIGTNGHIAFNEPDEALGIGTSVVELTKSTIESNSRFFDSIDDVPKKAITMGIGSIMKAKKIILLASGESKKEIMNKLLNTTSVTTYLPASLLHLHNDVTVIMDEDAN